MGGPGSPVRLCLTVVPIVKQPKNRFISIPSKFTKLRSGPLRARGVLDFVGKWFVVLSFFCAVSLPEGNLRSDFERLCRLHFWTKNASFLRCVFKLILNAFGSLLASIWVPLSSQKDVLERSENVSGNGSENVSQK